MIGELNRCQKRELECNIGSVFMHKMRFSEGDGDE